MGIDLILSINNQCFKIHISSLTAITESKIVVASEVYAPIEQN